MGIFLDWFAIGLYFAAIGGIAWYASRAGESVDGYFLAERRMPWWAITMSFVATSVSAISFVGGPEQGFFESDWYIYSNIGDIASRFVVAFLFIPAFYRLRVGTIYELLGGRFGLATQRTAAFYFLVTRLVSEAIRITAAVIVLQIVIGNRIPFPVIVVVYSVIVLGYVFKGGLKAVMYADCLQFCVFVVGLLFCFGTIVSTLPGGFGEVFHAGREAIQMRVVKGKDLHPLQEGTSETALSLADALKEGRPQPELAHRVLASGPLRGEEGARPHLVEIYRKESVEGGEAEDSRYRPVKINKFGAFSLAAGQDLDKLILMIIWGFFGATAAYGCDHNMAQRLLTSDKPRKAKMAMIFSGFLTLPIVFLFLFIGIALYAYNQHTRFAQTLISEGYMESGTQVFGGFIFRFLPSGIRGLLVAGILAAAMSTTSSGLNALAHSGMVDFYRPLVRGRSEQHYLRVSRGLILLIAVLTTAAALWFGGQGDLLWTAFKIVAFTYGGLLGVFLAAILLKRGNQKGTLAALFVTPLLVVLLFYLNSQFYLIPPSGGGWEAFPFLVRPVTFLARIPWTLYLPITAVMSFLIVALFPGKEFQKET